MPCGADVARIVESLYFIYLFGKFFYENHDSQNVPYIALYMLKGSIPLLDFRCAILNPSDIKESTGPVVREWPSELDEIYYDNRKRIDLFTIIEGLEVVLDIYTFLRLLHELDFINAGITIGKGITNGSFYIFFLVLSVIKHF